MAFFPALLYVTHKSHIDQRWSNCTFFIFILIKIIGFCHLTIRFNLTHVPAYGSKSKLTICRANMNTIVTLNSTPTSHGGTGFQITSDNHVIVSQSVLFVQKSRTCWMRNRQFTLHKSFTWNNIILRTELLVFIRLSWNIRCRESKILLVRLPSILNCH